MKRLRSSLAGLLVLATLGASGTATPSRALPWFMLVRGGGLEQPVFISRPAVLLTRPAFDRTGTEFPGDIPVIYAALESGPGIPPDFATRRSYDVAEFWGPTWIPQVDGSAPRSLTFEAGDTFARIYVGTHSRPPVWVRRSHGVDTGAMVIGDSGQAILTRAGLKLR
ncbi:MAG TPA: hypothetical protein VK636_21570 [Gemmatimonadaceae bacterium]|nr:hypothetical protein [Gemmatimonadaceae bacterium]